MELSGSSFDREIRPFEKIEIIFCLFYANWNYVAVWVRTKENVIPNLNCSNSIFCDSVSDVSLDFLHFAQACVIVLNGFEALHGYSYFDAKGVTVSFPISLVLRRVLLVYFHEHLLLVRFWRIPAKHGK